MGKSRKSEWTGQKFLPWVIGRFWGGFPGTLRAWKIYIFFFRLHSYQDEQILLSLVLQFANIRLHLGCEVDRKRKLRSSAFREAREDWMFCSPLSLWEKRRPFPPSLHISPWQPVFHLRRDHVYLMTPIKLSHILSKWYLSNTYNHFPKISFPIPHTSRKQKEKKPSF